MTDPPDGPAERLHHLLRSLDMQLLSFGASLLVSDRHERHIEQLYSIVESEHEPQDLYEALSETTRAYTATVVDRLRQEVRNRLTAEAVLSIIPVRPTERERR